MSRFRFIAQERTSYPVRQLCAVLRVSASGFYDWLKRQPSRREQTNAALSHRIRQVHESSRQTYGYLRVHAELRACGERVGKHRVARLMRQMDLKTKGRRRFRVTTRRDATHRRAPNLLQVISRPRTPTTSGSLTSLTLPLRRAGCIWQAFRMPFHGGLSAGR